MNLAIDVGNTFVKLAAFEGDRLVQLLERLSPTETLAYCNQQRPEAVILSSVNEAAQALKQQLNGVVGRLLLLDHTLPVPVLNLYKTPETLGMDRLAGVVGARALYPTAASLVIDAGTCVTYDFVDAQGRYQGGSIAPGLRMRFRAMHHFTARLPLLDQDIPEPTDIPLTGKSTAEAMWSGAVHGMSAEMQGIIHSYRSIHEPVQVIVCGGDARFFESSLKGSIFAVSKESEPFPEVIPHLVLIGLNHILQYNQVPNAAQS